MTIDQLKKNHAAAVAAEIAGEDVEFEVWDKNAGYYHAYTKPLATTDLGFLSKVLLYRIKPQPKLRPWKDISEVPLDALFRHKSERFFIRPTVYDPDTNEVTLNGREYGMHVLFDEHLHSLDGGTTWLPCGVAE